MALENSEQQSCRDSNQQASLELVDLSIQQREHLAKNDSELSAFLRTVKSAYLVGTFYSLEFCSSKV